MFRVLADKHSSMIDTESILDVSKEIENDNYYLDLSFIRNEKYRAEYWSMELLEADYNSISKNIKNGKNMSYNKKEADIKYNTFLRTYFSNVKKVNLDKIVASNSLLYIEVDLRLNRISVYLVMSGDYRTLIFEKGDKNSDVDLLIDELEEDFDNWDIKIITKYDGGNSNKYKKGSDDNADKESYLYRLVDAFDRFKDTTFCNFMIGYGIGNLIMFVISIIREILK